RGLAIVTKDILSNLALRYAMAEQGIAVTYQPLFRKNIRQYPQTDIFLKQSNAFRPRHKAIATLDLQIYKTILVILLYAKVTSSIQKGLNSWIMLGLTICKINVVTDKINEVTIVILYRYIRNQMVSCREEQQLHT
ncbi:MAG TPA: hypothetical protein VFJ05_06260, partial [Nitrososphaeraceae archaeon]|nr:hypothetical protein [Nitrososphaeraceae archaeon]